MAEEQKNEECRDVPSTENDCPENPPKSSSAGAPVVKTGWFLRNPDSKLAQENASNKQPNSTYVNGVNGAFVVKEINVPFKSQNASGDIDRAALAQNVIESDRDYRKITSEIIEKTGEQLKAHTNAKKPLRLILMWFVIGLLSLQFLALIAILFLNQAWSLKISDDVINIYIVSLFVETLTGLIIMIKFAFDSTQEVKLIEILNNIVEHFKKYENK